jgi:hypothetical protein
MADGFVNDVQEKDTCLELLRHIEGRLQRAVRMTGKIGGNKNLRGLEHAMTSLRNGKT